MLSYCILFAFQSCPDCDTKSQHYEVRPCAGQPTGHHRLVTLPCDKHVNFSLLVGAEGRGELTRAAAWVGEQARERPAAGHGAALQPAWPILRIRSARFSHRLEQTEQCCVTLRNWYISWSDDHGQLGF